MRGAEEGEQKMPMDCCAFIKSCQVITAFASERGDIKGKVQVYCI